MRILGDLFNLMLTCMAVGMVVMAIIFAIGYIGYKIFKRKRRNK